MLRTCSRRQLESAALAPGCAVLSMHDPLTPPPRCPRDVHEHLVLCFYDVDDPRPIEHLPGPTDEDARQVVAFLGHNQTREIIVQCEAGVSRSTAVALLALRLSGDVANAAGMERQGLHNRSFYRLLAAAVGLPPPEEPLVSLVVRFKYPVDRALAFLYSVRRQRWPNCEVVAVTDGGSPDNRTLAFNYIVDRPHSVRVIHTPERKGRWGHPYRQLGIAAAQGEFIGLQNDDNYLTPGYIEQLVTAMMQDGSDLAFCDQCHRYAGWSVVKTRPVAGNADLGCFLARASLVREVPWEGDDFLADGRYVERLAARAGNKISYVRRPLFVKN